MLEDPIEIDLSLSFSKISAFDQKGPKELIHRSFVGGAGVDFGSVTDDMITDRATGSKHCEEKYYLHNGNKPTATLGKLCDIIIEYYKEVPTTEKVLEIVKLNEMWPSVVKDDVLISKFDTKEFWDYIKIKVANVDKKVVMEKDWYDAQECVDLFFSHKHTRHLFVNGMENNYQYPFNFKYKGFNIRGIIDKMTIDHKKKMVYLEDIKTSSSNFNEFMKSFMSYRYYLQAAIYTKAFNLAIKKDLNLDGYTLAPFKFIFICRFEKVPVVFEVSEKWHNAAINGFVTSSGYKYKGLDQIIDDIYYHWLNKTYELPTDICRDSGKIKLEDNFINPNK